MKATPKAKTPWLDRPIPAVLAALLFGVVLAAPLWLFGDALGWFYALDPFGSFPILGDDFSYLAESRTTSALLTNLFTSHNAHVVPLFRIWIHVLGRLAGGLEGLPVALGVGSVMPLILVMLGAGHLVARETGRTAIGLGAMAILGTSTVVEPAAACLSASQSLWAAFMAVGMLIALQAWRSQGGLWRLGLAVVAAIAAPAFWSGGYAAGPAGAAYLWATRGGQRTWKLGAVVLATGTIAIGVSLLAISARSATAPASPGPPVGPILRLVRGVGHTGQAIPEVLVLGNLGMEAESATGQGLILSLGIAALWGWSRRGRGPIGPLEASGATLAVTGFLLAFVFRGGFEYASLRGLGWYHAMPQVGAVLFGAGWWSATVGAGGPVALKRKDAVAIVALVGCLQVIHEPRALGFFLGRVPEMSPWERKQFPIPELRRNRGVYLQTERVEWLRRSLARLDRLESTARELGASRGAIRRSIGRVYLPTWPEEVTVPDALDLLDLPADGPDLEPRAREAIREWAEPIPEPRPKYLPADEPWPTRRWPSASRRR